MAKESGAYSAFRLRKETVKYLQELKEAFQITYQKDFTNDEFIRQMAASVEGGDPAVWEVVCQMQENRRKLEELAASRRKNPKQ